MIKENFSKNIYLIYSEDTGNQNSTKDIAERIRKKLTELNSDTKILPIPIKSVYNPGISIDLIDYSSENCHIDITGGSKVMSYVVNQELLNNCNNILVSYLDPNLQNLNFSDNTYCSLKKFELSLEDLMYLHDLTFKNDKKPIAPGKNDFKVTQEILNIFGTNNFSKHLKIIQKYKKFFKDLKTENKNKLINYQNTIIDTIKFIEKLYGSADLVFNNDSSISKIRKLEKKLKMIDGIWFEVYIYELIQELLDENLDKGVFYELFTSVKIINKNANKDFEIDIILIINHKLYGISLTTSNEISLNKSKVFEIVYRSRQIGGDEAIAIFITTKDIKDGEFYKFQNDLKNDLNFKRKVKIASFPDPQGKKEIYKCILKKYIFGDLK